MPGGTSYRKKLITDEIILAGSPLAGGGILPLRNGAWVDPTNPNAADDDDLSTPFLRIQVAISALEAAAQFESGGLPYTSVVQMRFYELHVMQGIYDEDLVFPAGLAWRLIAYGQVTLGDGTLSNLGSTVPRSVTYQADPGYEPLGNQIRPTLMITTLAWGPTSSTHTGYACGFDITGDLLVADRPGAVPGGTTTELHLNQVKVRGATTFSKAGQTNCYLDNCIFSGAVTFPGTGQHLNLIRECEFAANLDALSYSRFMWCEFGGNVTVTAINDFLPPPGLYSCTFGAATTFTGPVGSFRVDAQSNYWAKTNGVLLGGAATKVILADTTP